ncbi:MAG: DEAD/DEAH box helicase [Myxococcota bacterium]
MLGPLWHFLLEFHVTDERGKVLGYRNLSELRRRIAPVLLRRDRAVVADQLPERIVQQVDVPMSNAQKALEGEALHQAAKLYSVTKRRPLTPAEQQRLMAALQTARMACNAAQLVDEESKAKAPKLEELGRLLEELCVDGGRKVVVFSQWERMTRMAEQEAHKLGLGTVRLHGGVPSGSRGKLLERFREEPDCQVFLSTDAGGVGLNLQSASALVNLDMPWNPAVLNQRIARVHRLGQKETAHILLMVSADSYEERVAAIVESKRHLFAHTVGPDASEDVVGISRKTLDLAMQALDDGPESRAGETGREEEREEEAPEPTAEKPEGRRAIPQDDDGTLARLVAEIQQRCGPRVERIVARRTGLLVVVDPPAEGDQELAALAPEGLEVAVLDPGTFGSLRRLGLADVEVVVERSEDTEAPPADLLGDLARRKLQAGEVLVQQGCHAEGLALLVEAMTAAVARTAGASEVPQRDDLTVWLYGEAIPSGRVAQEDATALLRADGLARAPAVPESLAAEVLRDARAMIPDETSAAQAGAVG